MGAAFAGSKSALVRDLVKERSRVGIATEDGSGLAISKYLGHAPHVGPIPRRPQVSMRGDVTLDEDAESSFIWPRRVSADSQLCMEQATSQIPSESPGSELKVIARESEAPGSGDWAERTEWGPIVARMGGERGHVLDGCKAFRPRLNWKWFLRGVVGPP